MLKSDSPASSVSIQCFEKEARSLAQTNHPNIVQIYEVERRRSAASLAWKTVQAGTGPRKRSGRPDEAGKGGLPCRVLASAVQVPTLETSSIVISSPATFFAEKTARTRSLISESPSSLTIPGPTPARGPPAKTHQQRSFVAT